MSNLNLLLHCGASAVDRNALSGVVLPAATKSFRPINHDYFADLVQDRLEDRGLRVVGEAHGLTKDGGNYFGMFEVRGRGNHADYSTVVGLRNSHVKEFAAQIAIGSGVFVCDNLAFSGEVNVGHKHTSMVMEHLPARIEDAMDKVIRLDDYQEQRFIAYKEREIANLEAEFHMIELFRKGILNTRTLPKVVQQWDEPDHEEFKASNAWKLFNACTESYKGLDPMSIQKTSRELHRYLDEQCEVPELELAA